MGFNSAFKGLSKSSSGTKVGVLQTQNHTNAYFTSNIVHKHAGWCIILYCILFDAKVLRLKNEKRTFAWHMGGLDA